MFVDSFNQLLRKRSFLLRTQWVLIEGIAKLHSESNLRFFAKCLWPKGHVALQKIEPTKKGIEFDSRSEFCNFLSHLKIKKLGKNMTQSIQSQPAELSKVIEQCPICWDDPMTDRIETVCGHVFDKHCLDTWLKGHTTCPLCRKVIKEQVESLIRWAALFQISIPYFDINGTSIRTYVSRRTIIIWIRSE